MSFTVGGSTPQLTFADATVQNTAALPLTGGSVSADITVNGLTVGRGAGAVSTNTAVGGSALAGNTSGASNTSLGYQALYSNTTASNNTAIGYQAGYSNITGTFNVLSGYQAGYSSVTANSMLFVGYQAGYYQTGGSNLGIGYKSLYGASGTSTGNYNIGIGENALLALTSGNYNTAIGVTALNSNTTASNNTAVGYQAGYNATSASNTFIGQGAGYYVTSGAKNTVIGNYNGNQNGLNIATSSNNIVLSDGDGNPSIGRIQIASVSTTAVIVSPQSGFGGLVFISMYNTTGGAQGWWLVAFANGTVTVVSSSNGTGLTVNFSLSSNSLRMATTSGTLAGASFFTI
jgi:hypothetical protein